MINVIIRKCETVLLCGYTTNYHRIYSLTSSVNHALSYQLSHKNEVVTFTCLGVPICASECDAWYEACKSDLICVENVLEDYNRTVNYRQECPAGKTCVNYTVMYGSGENMCTKMWGTSYKYVKKNGDNCMKFWFTPGLENPNANVLKDGGIMPCSAFSNKLLVAVILAMKAFLS